MRVLYVFPRTFTKCSVMNRTEDESALSGKAQFSAGENGAAAQNRTVDLALTKGALYP